MPKVKSRGGAFRALSVGAPWGGGGSVCTRSTATQCLPALTSRRRGSRAGAGGNHMVTSQEPASTSATVQPSRQEALLSPQLIETLVNKVADEVSLECCSRTAIRAS